MRASTYAILVGAWMLLAGLVCMLAPMAMLNTIANLPDDISFSRLAAGIFGVLSILVFVRPPVSKSLEEAVIRVISGIVIAKCLFVLCWPGMVSWLLERFSQFPVLVSGIGFLNMIFGILMVALASQVKKRPSQDSSPTET
jgi:hypothetical protein